MGKVEVVEEIAAPAAKVWELIREFGAVDRWAAGVESCSVEGEGVGAVRTLGMAGGLSLQEKLESFDDAGRSFGYAIVGDNPLPFRNYHSVVTVEEKGADRCTYTWTGTFEAEPATEAQASGIIRSIYTGGIQSLRKALGV
ncbi:MAG: SRPBCC family protein [Deltaproteobacteria bacterium]|nr:MAG: SRPBCC family protein [Deltaproteobacteria bacterium]